MPVLVIELSSCFGELVPILCNRPRVKLLCYPSGWPHVVNQTPGQVPSVPCPRDSTTCIRGPPDSVCSPGSPNVLGALVKVPHLAHQLRLASSSG